MNVVSFFAGAGGLDKGFEEVGFNIVWANEKDKTIWDTYKYNHPNTLLETKSIVDVKLEDIPKIKIDGVIGGPPCQSWSLAGAMRGIDDERGALFYEYLRLLKEIEPKFFVVENVPGIVSSRHIKVFRHIKKMFENCGEIGYNVEFDILNSSEFGVCQERKRVFLVGYRKDLNKKFQFNELEKFKVKKKVTLRECIGDLPEPVPAKDKNKTNGNILEINAHEYAIGGFSSIYMSRNRKKSWDQQSFTIQASGRHAPLHPKSAPMVKIEKDKWIFDKNTYYPYRRLSIRECARIQSFSDNFKFIYNSVMDGYKMVGNAVPVKLAKVVASQVIKDFNEIKNNQNLTDDYTNNKITIFEPYRIII
ncbi:modification methylase HaeIII [Clostridium acetireducens DSM 10703]|jgi:DNA (cytosine-5)-methyltransferase 1|uniref:Cytosine-specific methyltransferase n=1 Tax=Clostridium acetireducens DSM 10703 TaxID=1121290 RepID=A0A1E8EYZ4_9CLOT|nr:DNA cytosine methyltransferase [Clostridium acetireducens]OFI05902.1 modification methylase HaeIII [Clostridium acetireducens DSM 10703]